MACDVRIVEWWGTARGWRSLTSQVSPLPAPAPLGGGLGKPNLEDQRSCGTKDRGPQVPRSSAVVHWGRLTDRSLPWGAAGCIDLPAAWPLRRLAETRRKGLRAGWPAVYTMQPGADVWVLSLEFEQGALLWGTMLIVLSWILSKAHLVLKERGYKGDPSVSMADLMRRCYCWTQTAPSSDLEGCGLCRALEGKMLKSTLPQALAVKFPNLLLWKQDRGPVP